MKAAELRNKSIEELKEELLKCRKEAFNIRFQVASGQFESINRQKAIRKDIARLKTIMTEKNK